MLHFFRTLLPRGHNLKDRCHAQDETLLFVGLLKVHFQLEYFDQHVLQDVPRLHEIESGIWFEVKGGKEDLQQMFLQSRNHLALTIVLESLDNLVESRLDEHIESLLILEDLQNDRQ